MLAVDFLRSSYKTAVQTRLAVSDFHCSWKTLLRRSPLLEIAGKRLVRVFIAGSTLFTLAIWVAHPGVASAEAAGPDFFRVVGVSVDDVLNIRAEPSPRAPKLGEIPPGADCLRNLGCRGGLTYEEFTTLGPDEQDARLRENPRWCRIDYEGINGWVAGRYLGEGSCSRANPEP
jgi:hypothetical protein